MLEATLSDARGVLANKEATWEATNQILADLEGAIEGLVEADLTCKVKITVADYMKNDVNGTDLRVAGNITMKNENEKNYDGSKEIEVWMAGYPHKFLIVGFEDGYGEFDSGWYFASGGFWGSGRYLFMAGISIDGVTSIEVDRGEE